MLQTVGTLYPIKTQGPQCDLKDEKLRYAYHLFQKGHIIDESHVLKAKICGLINNRKIDHLYGPLIMPAYDRVELEAPITSGATNFLLDFIIPC